MRAMLFFRPTVVLLLAAAFGVAANAAPKEAGNGFVQVRGTELVDGAGEKLFLRGINLGNWLLPEGYMFHFDRAGSPRQIEAVVAELIGDIAAAEFWREWREQYITREDLGLIRAAGFNSVRLPINWRLFVSEHAPFTWTGPGWRALDEAINWAREESLYVVVDLHGAPSGQTGSNIDDSRGRPLLFDDPAAQQLTIDLWREIARRYRDDRTVLGYDLLNEPIAHYHDSKRLNPLLGDFYRRLVPAIREVDPSHIILLGGAQWNTQFEPLGEPYAPNLVYTFHLYWDPPEATSIKRYLAWRDRYHVPLWLGESGEASDEWIGKFRTLLEENDIGWCFWPYKKMDATTAVVSFPRPKAWAQIIAYAEAADDDTAEGRDKLRPSLETAREAFAELLKAIRLEHGRVNEGYVKALGLKTPTAPLRSR